MQLALLTSIGSGTAIIKRDTSFVPMRLRRMGMEHCCVAPEFGRPSDNDARKNRPVVDCGRWSLLVEVFHGSSAEDDEEAHPECGPLKWNDFVGFRLVIVVLGFKDDRVEEESQEAEHEK